MGYYVRTTDVSAILSGDKLDIAYERLVELNTHDEWKRGGSWSGGVQTSKHYSWMSEDYPSELKTTREVLEAVGYETRMILDDLQILGYDNKTGCEDTFIWAIADLFDTGSYIEWQGEEGERWRWDFGGGDPLLQREGEITWSDSQEMEPHEYGLVPLGHVPLNLFGL